MMIKYRDRYIKKWLAPVLKLLDMRRQNVFKGRTREELGQ